ncbi:MAG: hypothetical protein JNN07_05735 [Verrucomicrobiales bacterium]|nr:hypothetical protein [Verrucomicrobiales bacterium]
MAHVSKSTTPPASANHLFATVAETSIPATAASGPNRSQAKPDPSASSVNFEQTISEAVNKASSRPGDKVPSGIATTAKGTAEPSQQNRASDHGSPKAEGGASSSNKPLASAAAAEPGEDETPEPGLQPPTPLVGLIATSSATAAGGEFEEESQGSEPAPTQTKAETNPGPTSDLTLYLAASSLTSAAPAPVPIPSGSTGSAESDLSVSSATSPAGTRLDGPTSTTDQVGWANSSAPTNATRQNEASAAPNRPILPSAPNHPGTPAEALPVPEQQLVATLSEPVEMEGKSLTPTKAEVTQSLRQTDPQATPGDSSGAVPHRSQPSSTPPPAAGAGNAGTGEELLTRLQITARGTSVANEGEVMKTYHSAVTTAPRSETRISLERPAGLTPGGEMSISSMVAQAPQLETDLNQSQDSEADADREDHWRASMDRTSAATRSTAGIPTEGVEELARPTDLQSIEVLRNEILTRVVEFGDENPTSMTVVLRPDQGTELTVHLKSNDGRIEVQVRVEKGDDRAYRSSWDSLQQSLSQRGVSLAGLESAATPTLTRATTAIDLRNDAGGLGANLRAIEATVAAAGSSNLPSGSDQRESASRDSRTPTSDAGWESGEGSRGREQTFSFEDRNLGDEGRPGTQPPIWINPSRRGPLLTAEGANPSTLVPAGADTTTSAPWESWA